jgi:hypothetical protein
MGHDLVGSAVRPEPHERVMDELALARPAHPWPQRETGWPGGQDDDPSTIAPQRSSMRRNL